MIAVAIASWFNVAHAETRAKPWILVLPLPQSHAIDANVARAFDARLLVALDDTKRVVTVTHDEDPECTTMTCLAALGVQTRSNYVLSLSVVREQEGLTLFGTLVDTKSATAWRRVELSRIDADQLSKMAPAELVPQILGTTPAAGSAPVVGVTAPSSVAGRTAGLAITDQLTALRAFKVGTIDGTDRSALTHRAEIAISELTIARPRRLLCTYLDGQLVATFSVTELATGRVIFTKTVTVTASRREHFSSTAEVTDLLVSQAVEQWMTAFRQQGVLKPRASASPAR
jgi:hypothetical protein